MSEGGRRTHTDREYEARLRALREQLLGMAGRVEQMIGDSVRALTEQDRALAERTIREDRVVNRTELDCDELCLQILARWQPMASDLRFLTLALKMVTDLERIGDLAVNICERALALADRPPPRPYVDIPRMAGLAQGMIHDAIDAFVDRDAEKAQRVREQDDEVDRLYAAVFTDVLQLMRDGDIDLQQGIDIQSVAKWLERIADHGTNLAEEVIFLVQGRDVRHAGKLGTEG